MDAGGWLEALPPSHRPCVEQELERAIRYSTAVARMRRMESHLRASREEGVPLDEIIRSHHVTFTMDTLSRLTNVMRSSLDNFADFLEDAVCRMDVSGAQNTFEVEFRLKTLTRAVGCALLDAIDGGTDLDQLSIERRAVSVVDALWSAHAVPAIQAELTRARLELRHMRAFRDKYAHAMDQAEENRTAALIRCTQEKLNTPVDCASWHGVDVGAEGRIVLVGPASHVSLVNPNGAVAHLNSVRVPVQGITLPVVRLARLLRVLVYGGYLKLDMIRSETILRFLQQDIDKYTTALHTLRVELSETEGFDPEWVGASDELEPVSAPSRSNQPRITTTPTPSSGGTQDTFIRQIDMQTRLEARGQMNWVQVGLASVDADLEVDYASMSCMLVLANDHSRRCTEMLISATSVVSQAGPLLAAAGREYAPSSLVQKTAALFKKLSVLEFDNAQCEVARGRACALLFSGIDVVACVCVRICDILRQIERNATLPWKRVKRFRKRDKRKKT